MSEHTASIRLATTAQTPTVFSGASLEHLRGVLAVRADIAAQSLEVRFDRSLVSIADLVRTLEDNGLRVAGVAQRPGAAVAATVRIASA